MSQKSLETGRLLIRPFNSGDLLAIHRIFKKTFGDGTEISDKAALEERGSWLRWQILNQAGSSTHLAWVRSAAVPNSSFSGFALFELIR